MLLARPPFSLSPGPPAPISSAPPNPEKISLHPPFQIPPTGPVSPSETLPAFVHGPSWQGDDSVGESWVTGLFCVSPPVGLEGKEELGQLCLQQALVQGSQPSVQREDMPLSEGSSCLST